MAALRRMVPLAVQVPLRLALAVKAATGVVFHPVDGTGLRQALARLLALYRDRATWTDVQKAAMRQPVGWEMSAAAYAQLYQGLLG